MKSGNFPIKAVVLSDMVRREDNGKLMFIGTYGSKIGISHFPAPFSCFFTLIVSHDSQKLNSKLIRLVDPSNTVLFDAEFKFRIEHDETTAFWIIGPVFFQIMTPGKLSLEIESKADHWTTVESWLVQKAVVPGLFGSTVSTP